MSRKPKLGIAMLAKSDMCSLTAIAFMALRTDKKLDEMYDIEQVICTGQSDLPKGRSKLLTVWYDQAQPGDKFMFIDSDQIFTSLDILRSLYYLDYRKQDIVCGAYMKRDNSLTIEAKDAVSFYKKREGELFYGATGFMMMTYEIVDIIAKQIGPRLRIATIDHECLPFFFHRIVTEKEIGFENLWLGEDYSFCWLARQHGAKLYGYISDTIGHIIPTEKFPNLPKIVKWSNKSIVYYCTQTMEEWSPLKKGIGGSENAVIHLTKEWAKIGYEVTVYCSCDKPGIYDGVTYLNHKDFRCFDEFNILIIWRSMEALQLLNIDAKLILFDAHDLLDEKKITERFLKNVHKICVKSKFHGSILPKDKYVVIPNGGAYDNDQIVSVEKDPNYLIYASSYDRGLPHMLKWGWPRIKKACPDAYLKIYYGWDGFDAVHKNNPDGQEYKKQMQILMSQDGVSENGRIDRSRLLIEKGKANIHYYVGNFQETDCISVRESACVGAIPVVPENVEVFREKSYCTRIEGELETQELHERAADEIIKLIQDKKYAEQVRNSMKVSKNETWEKIAEKWEQELFSKVF